MAKREAKREMEALCQVCYSVEPSELASMRPRQLRCCVGCLVWLSEGGGRGEPAVGTS